MRRVLTASGPDVGADDEQPAPVETPSTCCRRGSPGSAGQRQFGEPVGLIYLGDARSTMTSGDVTVFVDQTAKDLRPLDSAVLGPLDGCVGLATDVDVSDGRQLFQCSVRAMGVVVILVLV